MRHLAFVFALTAALAGCGDDGTPQPTGTTTATDPQTETTSTPTTSGGTTADDETGSAEETTSTGDDTTGVATAETTGDDTTTGPPQMVSFAADIQPILTATCVANCHEPGGSGFGETMLDMTDGVAYVSLVDVPAAEPSGLDRIEPGTPDASYLWHKISGTQASVGGVGATMPIGTTLEPAEVDLIEQWILGGALP